MHKSTAVALALLALSVGGCGGGPSLPPAASSRTNGAGSIHALVQGPSGAIRALSVDYAAAGLAVPTTASSDGSLVVVGVFRDGRVDDALDLQTFSIGIPLSQLPERQGALDVTLDASDLDLLLEGSGEDGSRVLSPTSVKGTLHLRYDSPPRPGIVLRGEFSLVVETAGAVRPATLHLDGELEVPVLGS